MRRGVSLLLGRRRRIGAAGSRLACLALLVALGCAVNPVTGERELVLMSPEREKAIGREAAEAVAREIGIVDDPALASYISAIGGRLAERSPRRDVPYEFHVVGMPEANAFALPGGYVYVSRGLLALANDEDELANVLAHEVAHVAARHAAQRETRAAQVGLLSVLGTVAAAVLGGPEAARATAQIGQVAGAGLIATYSRDQERDADRIGQELAASAGWDPSGMATFLRSLERETALRTGRSPRPTFLDSHPSTPERAKSAAARAVALPRRAAPPIAGTRAAFLARLEGLLIGADPAEGVLRDGSFLHPELGFGVRFPDGWRTENARTEVRAIDPREAAILVLLAQEAGEDARRAAQRYAERQGVSLLEAGPARVHGVAAFRARALLPTQQAVLALDLTWLPHRGVVYRVQGVTTQPELSRYAASFLRAAQSFRSLTDEERATIRERRLRLAKAREGETLAELSRRTGNLWSSSETAVMNGRNETERLRAGELVKIAVEAPYRRRGGP